MCLTNKIRFNDKNNCRNINTNQRDDNRHKRVVNKQRVETNYDILGISQTATQKEIKSAYYSLSKTCHPDVNQSTEAAKQFRDITDAYEVLANSESKRIYDRSIAISSQELNRNNLNINQQNLDNFRKNNKFSDNFSDRSEEYRNKWIKRRTIRMENVYKDKNQNQNHVKYEDPLKYEPKGNFKNIYNEELHKRYADYITKEEEQLEKQLKEESDDIIVKVLFTFVVFTALAIVYSFCENVLKLSEPTVKIRPSVKETPVSDNSK